MLPRGIRITWNLRFGKDRNRWNGAMLHRPGYQPGRFIASANLGRWAAQGKVFPWPSLQRGLGEV